MSDKSADRKRVCRTSKWSGARFQAAKSHPRPIRVFVADNREIIRFGVRSWLKGERHLTVVGEADNADDLLTESCRTKPNIVLLQSGLSNGSDSEMYERLIDVLPSVSIVSLVSDDEAVFRTVKMGAYRYIRENTSRNELVRALLTIAQEDASIGPKNADQTVGLLGEGQDILSSRSILQALSPQEQRVVALIAEGCINKEIATKMVLSEKTVKNYISNIFAKLAIQRRTQAVALCFRAQQGDMAFGNGLSSGGSMYADDSCRG